MHKKQPYKDMLSLTYQDKLFLWASLELAGEELEEEYQKAGGR